MTQDPLNARRLSKRKEPIHRKNMIETIVPAPCSKKLVQIPHFQFRASGTAELFSHTNKCPVLRKGSLLAEIGYVKINKRFVPSDQTNRALLVKWAISLKKLSKPPSRVAARFDKSLLQTRARKQLLPRELFGPQRLLPNPVFVKHRIAAGR